MALQLNKEQLKQIKQQLTDTQKESHLVIFKSVSPKSGGEIHMITNYGTFETLQKQRPELKMEIVRDIVPVTDSLAYWAVAQDTASHLQPNDPNAAEVALQVEQYTNNVLADNKLPQNK
ncbi:hypothetical protein AKUA2103_14100 [Apilactobacillus kunkeei]|nr:hypothetical protein AKUA2103_14100 [Apilactobacillus kunkeei]CAI2696970.1 hypothetical protein AKUA1003_14120 [Apilactobacillus kunkeei]